MRSRWMWNIRLLLVIVWSECIATPSYLSHITNGSQAQPCTDRRRRLLACVDVKKTVGCKNTVKYLGRYLGKHRLQGRSASVAENGSDGGSGLAQGAVRGTASAQFA